MVNDTWGAGKENQLVESKISHKLHQRSVTDMTTEQGDRPSNVEVKISL